MKKIILCNLKELDKISGASYFLKDIYHLSKSNGLDVKVLMPISRQKNFQIDEDDIINIPYFRNSFLKWLVYFFMVPLRIPRGTNIVHFSLDLPIISTKIWSFIFNLKYEIVSTVHDLGEFKTVRYSKLKDLKRRIIVPLELNFIDHFICVSETTKIDLMNLFGVEEKLISIVYNPILSISNIEVDKGNLSKHLQKYAEEEYLLYVSSLNHPSKNHVGLLKAYELVKSIRPSLKLVLVGKKFNNHEVILNAIENHTFYHDISYLGYLKNEEVSWLFKNCLAYVFPSNFEGFGRGVIEAWIYEKPLVVSNAGSLPEVAGNAGHYFDPSNPKEMALKIIEVLDNKNLQSELVNNGKKRLDLFSSESVIAQLRNAYRIATK